MKNVAVLFPGQGSQSVGMGKSFYDRDSLFRTRFDGLAEELGIDLKELCFTDSPRLNEIELLQLTITALSALIYDSAEPVLSRGNRFFAGHSLGEFGALRAAGVLDRETLFGLVRYRGRVMAEAALTHPGKMAAVLGGDPGKIESVCQETAALGLPLQVANYNSPAQTVISGTSEALEAFSARQGEIGFKRLIPLKVPGAFHSELMAEAADRFFERMHSVQRNLPSFPVVMNADARMLDPSALDETLAFQLKRPVRFLDSVYRLRNLGVDLFVEIGPGEILANLVRRIVPEAYVLSVNAPEDIERLEEIL